MFSGGVFPQARHQFQQPRDLADRTTADLDAQDPGVTGKRKDDPHPAGIVDLPQIRVERFAGRDGRRGDVEWREQDVAQRALQGLGGRRSGRGREEAERRGEERERRDEERATRAQRRTAAGFQPNQPRSHEPPPSGRNPSGAARQRPRPNAGRA